MEKLSVCRFDEELFSGKKKETKQQQFQILLRGCTANSNAS